MDTDIDAEREIDAEKESVFGFVADRVFVRVGGGVGVLVREGDGVSIVADASFEPLTVRLGRPLVDSVGVARVRD